ncbi:MAG: hypothetical protein ACFFBL_10840 [Promethearchaeota archaeon]
MQERKVNKRLGDGQPARIKQVSYPQRSFSSSLTRFVWIVGGLFLAATLLVPVFWIPGLVILVLPIEVYLLDWVHSQYTKSLVRMSLFDNSSESDYDFEDTERKRDAISRSRQWEFAR